MLTGTGTAGAYHAGVLRALREAGVKIDLVAGRGIGAVGAIFTAVDGGAPLWDDTGVWRSSATRTLYGWRGTIRASVVTLAVALVALLLPLTALVGAAVVYPIGFLLRLLGSDAGNALSTWYSALVDVVFQPSALPLFLPRFVMLALLVLLGILVVGEILPRVRTPTRRRARGLVWWRLIGAPLEVRRAADHFSSGLWKIMRGAARIAKPTPDDLAERYAELLSDNLGQPEFRELIVTVHDLDARRDLVCAVLQEPFRRPFFARRLGAEGGHRHLETLDLAGSARRHAVDALVGPLSLPVATDSHLVRFAPESGWRGETHHVCDRPEAMTRLLEEVANAGVEQIIVVSALSKPPGPHALESSRRDARGRAGEHLVALETAAERDALMTWGGRFQAVFLVQPEHNPLGPFDFDGGYDERSDRRFPLSELVDRGREDGFRQFVDPVVGASGEWIEPRRPAARAGAIATSVDDAVATSKTDS